MVKQILGRIFYGLLFVAVLPVFLFFWTAKIDSQVYLPAIQEKKLALILAVFGGLMIVWAWLDLARIGRGLPMNAYPPKNFVSQGIYRLLAHPIYVGAGFLAFAGAMWFGSPAGIYVTAPVFVLAMVSLVNGYEKQSINKIFGDVAARYRPVISLPVSGPIRKLFIGAGFFSLAFGYLAAMLYLFGFDFGDNVPSLAFAAALLFILSINYPAVWRTMKNFAQWIANSRKDYRFFCGRFRVINHALYSGLAGFVGVGILAYVIGNSLAVLVLAVAAILGGALFAQLRWGSPSLLRPYGFWGGIIGGVAGMILIRIFFGVPMSQTMLAAAVAIPPAQAIGRLRCLAQGCCHGIECDEAAGIKVWQPQSRVVMLSEMKNVPIHATQLYSIIFNAWLTSLLFAVWLSGKFAAPLVIGIYLILTGIERFTEDSYRGEKQTRMAGAIQENQWIAINAILAGMLVALLPWPLSMPALGNFDWGLAATAVIGGLWGAFAMSMDFPKSNIKYSRLSG